jgi:hypothetical protein
MHDFYGLDRAFAVSGRSEGFCRRSRLGSV